jgi:hypothetical protein
MPSRLVRFGPANDLVLQQQSLPQHEQWQRQVVVLAALRPAFCAEQWQFGSKCPLGLMQPETDRPLIAANGTIAQTAAAGKPLRIERIRRLPVMLDTK